MISGLLLVYPERNLDYFWSKKAAKLLPLYYLSTLLVYAIRHCLPGLAGGPVSPPIALVKSIIFIPHVSKDTILFIYPVLWFLYAEIFIQLVFFVCTKILASRYKAGFFTISIILLLNLARQYISNVYLNFYGNIQMLYFIPGFLTGIFLQKKSVSQKQWKRSTSYIIILGTIIGLYYSTKFAVNIFNVFPLGFLFFVSIYLFHNIQVPPSIQYLSKISYSFYIIHYFVNRSFFVFLYDKIKNSIVPIYLYIGGALLCISVAAILATISYFIFEYKVSNILISVLKKCRQNK